MLPTVLKIRIKKDSKGVITDNAILEDKHSSGGAAPAVLKFLLGYKFVCERGGYSEKEISSIEKSRLLGENISFTVQYTDVIKCLIKALKNDNKTRDSANGVK